jgi:hypothetical protein
MKHVEEEIVNVTLNGKTQLSVVVDRRSDLVDVLATPTIGPGHLRPLIATALRDGLGLLKRVKRQSCHSTS